MTASEPFLIDRRRRVGAIAVGCFAVAVVGFFTATKDSAWPSAFMRVGIVLGSLWLSLPAANRSATWTSLTRGRLAAIVLVAVAIQRIKFLLPIVAVGGILLWISRPKSRRR